MRMVYLALFLFGGGAYVLLELAWRGRSHASMLAAGGVCLTPPDFFSTGINSEKTGHKKNIKIF